MEEEEHKEKEEQDGWGLVRCSCTAVREQTNS